MRGRGNVLPFYFVCDESAEMGRNGGIKAINAALPQLHSTIASDPRVSELCRIGLITYADTAEELMSLTNLADVVAMPGIQAHGGRRFGPVFDLLRNVVDRDVRALQSQGYKVYRPAVFFITAGEPADSLAWQPLHRALVDRQANPNAPNIIAFGIDGALDTTVQEIGTLASTVSTNGVSIPEVLEDIIGPMINTILDSGPTGAPDGAVVGERENTGPPGGNRSFGQIGSDAPQLQGGTMTVEYATGENILPFYIVCDESGSMGPNGGINAINAALPELHSTIASDPLVSDKCRIGLITFSDTAEELMSLTNLADVVAMPGMQSRGMTNYGQVFDLLKTVISRDIANLKSQGYKVYRPAVFFITDGEPTDVATWESSYRSLVDKNTNRHAPNIIAFGVDGADATTIGKVGTLGGFVSTSGVSPADSLREIIGSLTNTIFDSASSSTPQLVVPAAPVGTTAVPLEEV